MTTRGEDVDKRAKTTTVRCVVPDGVARLIFPEAQALSETQAKTDDGAPIPLYLSIEAPADRPHRSGSSVGQSAVTTRPAPPSPATSEDRVQEIATLSNPDRYESIDVLGRGGMGVVRRVMDRVLGREAAMKAIEGTLVSRPLEVLRFLEEAQITGQLDHPSVVPVHDFGIADRGTRAYFTMKLVRGESLGQLISLHHAIGLDGRAIERLLGIFLRVCEGVSFAHSRNVVHRDLKPENILVGSHGQVYVMDWGLARVVEGGRPSEKAAVDDEYVIAGTPAFMAPEQADGRLGDIDARTDVFGLGGLLYAMLTNRGPFSSQSSNASLDMARAGIVKSPDTVTPRSIPPELVRITMKALSAERADRYQSAEDLAHDVEIFLRGGGWFATRHYPGGAIIVKEGDSASEAFVITDGRCEVYKLVDGVKLPLRVLGPGDVFGETAVFTAKSRTATVEALVPVTVKVVTRDSLERELDRSPWMGAFVRALAERFRDIDEKLSQREGRGPDQP